MSVTRQTCARRWSSSGRGALERSPESLAPRGLRRCSHQPRWRYERRSGDDLVGNVKLRRLLADPHHGGHPVNVVGDVLTGNVFGDRQTIARTRRPVRYAAGKSRGARRSRRRCRGNRRRRRRTSDLGGGGNQRPGGSRPDQTAGRQFDQTGRPALSSGKIQEL
jgi:hypothetical protein